MVPPRGLNFYLVIYRDMLKKIFFSRTIRPISTNLGRKHAWGIGIKICSNKGAGPSWGPLRGKIRKILINLQKSLDKEIQVCSDQVLGVTNGHALIRGHILR